MNIQWNLRTTDKLGAGSSSVVERLSASGGFVDYLCFASKIVVVHINSSSNIAKTRFIHV